jgi:hypothetical protein
MIVFFITWIRIQRLKIMRIRIRNPDVSVAETDLVNSTPARTRTSPFYCYLNCNFQTWIRIHADPDPQPRFPVTPRGGN